MVYVAVPMVVTARERLVGVLALVTSVMLTVLVVGGTLVALAIEADSREAGDCETVDHPQECDGEGLIALVGVSLTGLGLWGAGAGGGVLLGRRWARQSTMVVFTAWALLVSAGFIVTAVDNNGLPLAGVLTWTVMVGAFVTIVVLADKLPRQRARERSGA